MTDLLPATQSPRIAVTGPDGFVAWHVRCAARARWGGDLIHLGRAEFANPELMDAGLASAEAVIHLAGVNRANEEADIERVNPWLAEQLVASLTRTGRIIPVVNGNSIHSLGDSVFGVSKRRAAEILVAWAADSGAPVVDVMMPNIFGEHGRPHYNSVTATFSHLIARAESPTLVNDRELPLIHVQRVADVLLDQALVPTAGPLSLDSESLLVSDLLMRLESIALDYRTGVLPDLADPFIRDLFNTYRAATFPERWPIHPLLNSDQRGGLVETVKAGGGQTQVFYSTTNPGFTRGQHWHRRKVERFLVLRGEAEIRLRKLFSNEVACFPVSGERPAIIDMPTMWVHSITNTGPSELLTLFYADEIFDPGQPDTYPEDVES